MTERGSIPRPSRLQMAHSETNRETGCDAHEKIMAEDERKKMVDQPLSEDVRSKPEASPFAQI